MNNKPSKRRKIIELLNVRVGDINTEIRVYKKLTVRGRILVKNKVLRALVDPGYVPKFPFEVEYITTAIGKSLVIGHKK